jgi:hypothetical protein
MIKNLLFSYSFFLIGCSIYGQSYIFTIGGEPGNDGIALPPVNHVLEVGYYNGIEYTGFVTVATGGAGFDWNCSVSLPFKPDILRSRYTVTNDICYTKLLSPSSGSCYQNQYDNTSHITFCNTLFYWRGYSISVTPDIQASSPSPNIVSSCDNIILNATAGFPAGLYHWQYLLPGGTWLPYDYSGASSIEVGIDDIPNLQINQTVNFRLEYCPNRYSPIFSFSFNKCSPDLVSLVPISTNCSYSNDGGFTATFSRALNPGESLLLNLAQNAPVGNPGSILVAAPIITSANMVGSTYNWPNTLAAGTYYLRYQLDNDGSVYDYGPFNITTPTPVTFDAMWMNINCFGETGSIDITANGGVGNYQYELNGNGSWVNFTNPNEHLVTGLLTGNYQLRVRDANGCTEQN